METRASPRGLSLVWAVLWPGELSAALTETSTSEHLNTGGRDRRTNGTELCTGEDLRPTQGRGRGCAELGAMSHNTVRADGRGTQERDAGPRGEGPQSSRLFPGDPSPSGGPLGGRDRAPSGKCPSVKVKFKGIIKTRNYNY